MGTSCGRSDGEHTNQATEIPRAYAFFPRLSLRTDYYNRLECSRSFRFLYAAMRSLIYFSSMAVKRSSRVVAGALHEIFAPRPFLSLLQGPESCHKQFWGVTPFRRGIA
jgi:hypothetical protein